MQLPYTRAMISAALGGALDQVPYRTDPIFGLSIPAQVPGVPLEVLDPRSTWADGEAYDRQAQTLAGRFHENFKQFAGEVDSAIANAGPAA